MNLKFITTKKEPFTLIYYEIIETQGQILENPFYIAFTIGSSEPKRFSGITKEGLFKGIKKYVDNSNFKLENILNLDEADNEIKPLILTLLKK